MPRQEPREMRTLGPYEIDLLAEAIDARYRALILTAAGTGLRFGELAGLRPSRIDMVNHTLTVAQALKEVRGQVVEGTPKKAAARRTIPLPRLVIDAWIRTSQQAWHRAAISSARQTEVPCGGPIFAVGSGCRPLRHL